MKTEVIHIRVLTEHRKKLRILSAQRECSMTQLMGEILDTYFEKIKGVTE